MNLSDAYFSAFGLLATMVVPSGLTSLNHFGALSWKTNIAGLPVRWNKNESASSTEPQTLLPRTHLICKPLDLLVMRLFSTRNEKERGKSELIRWEGSRRKRLTFEVAQTGRSLWN